MNFISYFYGVGILYRNTMLKSVKAIARDLFIGFFYGLNAVVNRFDLKVGSNGSDQRHNSNNNGLQAVVSQSLMIRALAHKPSFSFKN